MAALAQVGPASAPAPGEAGHDDLGGVGQPDPATGHPRDEEVSRPHPLGRGAEGASKGDKQGAQRHEHVSEV